MSYTEIYAFDKAGLPRLYGEVRNSWRGARAVWNIMEERHLPPFVPGYVKSCNWYHPGMTPEEVERRIGYKPSRALYYDGKDEPAREIWNLVDSPEIPEHERIVLYTTFDDCLVRAENLPAVIEAFRKFGGDTSLKEQADILQRAADDPEIMAVGWNQTSVNGTTWDNDGGYDDEAEKSRPYNCLIGDKHFWLFDELRREAGS